jgi:ferritin-like metal-binding protein YciE
MEMDSLSKLYVEELKDLHSAERQIIQALPKMIKKASDERLRAALSEHLEVTKEQLARLDQIFEKLGKRATGKKCRGMEGLIEEGKEMMEEDMEPEVLDAALISAAQKVEHYEMAGYGTVRTYANLLGEKEAARLLQKTLDEEGEADKKLSQLAESSINVEAAVGA